MRQAAETSISDMLMLSFQRDFPLVHEPFTEIANRIGAKERDVRASCAALLESGVVARIGGVVRPNTIAASTLAAVAVPELSTDSVAEAISGLDGVNHVYLRENPTNIWFVATGPHRGFVDATLARVEELSGKPVLDLRLEESFHIDLGFPLKRSSRIRSLGAAPTVEYRAEPGDLDLVQALTSGISLSRRPFLMIGENIGLTEDEVLARLKYLLLSRIITRIGIIIRHRALGWRSNAMVVWDVEPDHLGEKARILAEHTGINLCYRRRRYEERWPYNLYCMIHAKSRESAFRTLERASRRAGLDASPRQVLFSTRCYKQTGALIVAPKEVA